MHGVVAACYVSMRNYVMRNGAHLGPSIDSVVCKETVLFLCKFNKTLKYKCMMLFYRLPGEKLYLMCKSTLTY